MGGNQRSHAMTAQADRIRQTYEAQSALFLHALCARLERFRFNLGRILRQRRSWRTRLG
ncbi:hypothetical protein QO001_001929 [Methylobacterium brachiatum]|uniref:Uncharacterized protein n=1 Tax=Methylobacterium brachiatum TaxID=269660 RepID=A0AAJ1TLP2_9HYPH|nr:hypothetical protein [Methylobacterium brachiatum]